MADIRNVILGCRSIFQEIGVCPVSVAAQCFCQDQPALRLGEYTGIFFGALIVDHGKGTGEGVSMIGRIHQDGSKGGV